MKNGIKMCFVASVASCLWPLQSNAQQPSQYGGLSPNFQNFQNAPYGQNSPYYGPNNFGPINQQLSPYLNLLRNNNAAVNYFNFVKPGLSQGIFGAPFLGSTGMGGRQTFFPQVDTLSELDETTGQHAGMRPSGHPFGFNNTLGYFGPMGMGANRNANSQGPLANKTGTMGGK